MAKAHTPAAVAVKHQKKRRSAITRELAQLRQQQKATAEVLKLISSSGANAQPVFEAIAEIAARLCEARVCFVYRFDGSLLYFMAQHGLSPEAIQAMHRVFPMKPSRQTAGGRAVLSGMVEHIPDVRHDPEYAVELADAVNSRSVVAVPIVQDGRAVGAIALDRTEPGNFPEVRIELLETFAAQAVIAIENARLFEEVQARTAELSKSLQQQTATADVLRVISRSAFDLQSVLDTLVEAAARLCHAEKAGIVRPLSDGFRYVSTFGFDPLFKKHWEKNGLPMGRGSAVGRAVLAKSTVHIHDTEIDPEYTAREGQRLGGIRTILAVPLMRDDLLIGVLVLTRSTVQPFSDKEIELVTTFADQAVIAIENVRLFEEVQARTTELDEALQQQTATTDVLKVISRSAFDLEAVLQTLIDSAASLCGADRGSIYVRDGDVFRVAASHNLSEEYRAYERSRPHRPGRGTIVGRVALEGVTQHVPDIALDREFERQEIVPIADFRAIFAAPILRDGQVIGAFALVRREPGPFAARQIELVETFADQAVIAIENARLFEEVQVRNRDLTESLERQTAMSEILRVISSSPNDVQPVFETIAESAARLCNARFCSVHLFEGELIHFVAQHGMPPEAIDAQRRAFPMLPGRGSVASRAILYAAIEQVPDVAADPDYQLGQTAQALNIRSILAVPMLRDGRPVGSINIGRREKGYFPSRQIEVLQTFADQAVIAIENVRLFEQVQARTAEVTEALQQQTATADVLKVISRSAFDLDVVLQTLVESAIRLCGGDKGVITLREGDELRYRAGAGQSAEHRAYEETHPHRIGRGTFQGRAALERTTIHVPDVLADPEYERKEAMAAGEVRAVLSVPLKRGAEVIGVFGLAKAEAGPFAPRQIELVETFADQAIIAIENVRLFEEVESKTRDLEEALTFQQATSNVLEVIGRSASNLQPVFDVILDTAADLCHADMSVLRLMRDGTLQHVASSRRNDPAVVQLSRDNPILPADRSSVAGRVALGGHTIHIPDTAEDREYTFLSALDSPIGSVLGVPLMQDGKVAGVIALLRRVTQPFTERQIELVETFAGQAVIAIGNVRLFEEVQERTEELSRSLGELRTAQDRLIQTEKLASLGQLTAGIAHEIKNPLNFINNFAAVSAELVDELRDLLDSAALADKAREEVGELSDMLKGNLDKVVQHGKRADSIVKNMLQHSREGSGEHRPVDINAIVEESLNLAYHGARAERKGFNITLERSLDPQAGEVDLYPQELTRVLLNLISNGFYATVKRGNEADGAGYDPVLKASTRNLGDRVEIRVRDNGTGIPPEVKAKIFNPFFTTKPAGEGTGLGLSLSHDIVVKQHAGTIEVDTEPGEFTEFRIVLPRAAASLGSSGAPA